MIPAKSSPRFPVPTIATLKGGAAIAAGYAQPERGRKRSVPRGAMPDVDGPARSTVLFALAKGG